MFNIIRLEKLGSTNQYLHSCLEKGEEPSHGTIVVTENQTAGKGMEDNIWYSELGKNLTLSVFLKPVFLPPEKQFVLNKAIALAVADFVQSQLPHKKITIKWPNDIYIDDKKAAGLLISNSIKGNKLENVIVGIGININQTEFPREIPNPASIGMFKKENLDLDDCLGQLSTFVARRYEEICAERFHDIEKEYVSKLYRLGKIHKFIKKGDIFNATITGVSEYGQLQLKTSKGENLQFGFKEVEYVIGNTDVAMTEHQV